MSRAFVLVLGLASLTAAAHPGEHAAVPRSGTVAQAPFMRGAGVYRRGPVALVRSDGTRVALDDELAFDGPVVINFIFTSCSAVCPIATRTLAELQERLRPGESVRIMSISLDPLNDTPDALRAYARKAGARAGWRFYTGSVEASIAAQRAFDLFRGDKMNHVPVTLVRSARGAAWTRLEGFPTAAELAAEVRAEVR
jgi:protein SCO1/2